VHNTSDTQRLGVCVDDEISVDRPKENSPRGEVRALAAYSRHRRELVEHPMKILQNTIGGVKAVVGEIFPDVLKIP